jgi:large subunit ribosomal protein L24
MLTKLKKNDIVIINNGTEKGKKGKVIKISAKNNSVLVEGINVRTRHVKAKKQGQESGIIKKEAFINLSKVNYYCDKCEKGVKLGIKVDADKNKTRFCKKCNEIK